MATMVQAVRMALHVGESRLGVTDIFGEDVGPPLGGVFTATQGLRTAWNTPLDERGIIGAAMGLALAGEGVDVELIDLRSLHPYDWATVSDSIKKTGRVVFANEDTEVTNFGEHLVRRAVEELWDVLKTPPVLEAGKHLPGVGLAEALENASVPGAESIKNAIHRAVRGSARKADQRRTNSSLRFTAEPTDARAAYDEMVRAHRHR